MRTLESIALGIPEVLLPREGVDPTKWAVIACDQYTSEPEYWAKTAAVVGDAPSTLNLIYPEVFLHEPEADKAARIARIRETMARYLAQGLFRTEEGIVYVERKTGGHIRRGLVVALDLEAYDYRKGASTLIRATEGTILDRIPPRVRIRDGAPLETPHIMVLIDDPADTVIGPLAAAKDRMPRLYDFELMLGSGRLAGYRIADPAVEAGIARSLSALADPRAFASRYGLPAGTPVLLYAMGDGNHSLATAKTIWETTKEKAADKTAVMASPLRYAMVELVNLHDPALVFEPIHRVVFDIAPGRDLAAEAKAYFDGRAEHVPMLLRAHHEGDGRGAVRPAPQDRDRLPDRVRHARDRGLGAEPPGRLPAGLPGRLHEERRGPGDRLHPRHRQHDQPGRQAREHGLHPPGHAQGGPVQDRHPGRRHAPQDLLHGRGLGEAVLHGSPPARLKAGRRSDQAAAKRDPDETRGGQDGESGGKGIPRPPRSGWPIRRPPARRAWGPRASHSGHTSP